MKTAKADKAANPFFKNTTKQKVKELETEHPLSEKDEVKKAESNSQKNQKNSHK